MSRQVMLEAGHDEIMRVIGVEPYISSKMTQFSGGNRVGTKKTGLIGRD